MEWMILPLKRYVQFGGRSRRQEFWLFILFQVGVSIVAALIDYLLGFGRTSTVVTATSYSAAVTNNGPVATLASLFFLIPSLAVTFRRLHDTDRSAWWLLLVLLPILGWIALFVFYCLDGTPGPNRFGSDPKQRGADDLHAVFR